MRIMRIPGAGRTAAVLIQGELAIRLGPRDGGIRLRSDALACIETSHAIVVDLGGYRRANQAKVSVMDNGSSEIVSIAAYDNLVVAAGRPRRSLVKWKRLFDVAFATAALAFATPIIIAAALLVSLDGGTPFYSQPRLGFGGRRFTLYKLRTMCTNADVVLEGILRTDARARDEFTRTHRLRRDPRVSWIGEFLRTTCIDELPQLINVLKGDMSIVGPRPRTLRWLSLPDADTPVFAVYYDVRPGITGLWQVSARSKFDDQMRIGLDAAYVSKVSFWTDLWIISKTISLILTAGLTKS